MPLLDWLRHAFAVEKPGPVQPTEAQGGIVDRLCREVVRRRMTTPALVALEMGRPLNFVTAQAIHFFDPLIKSISDANGHREFAAFLEQRGSMDFLAQRIEELEAEASRKENGDDRNGGSEQAVPRSDSTADPPD